MNSGERKELIGAVVSHDLKKIRSVLARASNLTAADEEGFDAIHWAAQEGFPDAILLLIEFGADPNATDKNGFSPLHLAAGEGHSAAVRALIRGGAELNKRCSGNDGSTALHAAAVWNRSDVAHELISLGADTGILSDLGETPEQLAIAHDSTEVLELLRQRQRGQASDQ